MNEYLMYLRKSRADNPDETVEEVLLKHYTILQDFCEREFGFRIPEKNIYREVVSGESIEERVEIKKVLSRIEDPEIKGLVVIEPQRLSRGDLIDCGTLINILQYSHTRVFTPTITYNIENKMERRFFQDELMRGRDYLEYTKEILMRGKLASVNRGCYIQHAPYGYDRIKIGRDNTLAPNKYADTVKLIFDMYVYQNATAWEICRELNRLGVKTPSGKDVWKNGTVDKILKNHHYNGKVTFQKCKTTLTVEDGVKVKKRVYQKEGEYLCTEGKHPAIIDDETFIKAQERLATRAPVGSNKIQRNAFAGLMYCAKCGHIMYFKDRGSNGRQYLCCDTLGCSKSVKYTVMVDTVVAALEQSELPALVSRYTNGDGEAAAIQKKLIQNLERELAEMKDQEEHQYELLETRVYSQELFDRRNRALREKMADAEERIKDARRTMPDAVDYKERIASLEEAIQALKNPEVEVMQKNLLLKAIIDRIECTSNYTEKRGEFDFSLKIKLRI